jgi:hypothetical protein
MRPLQTLTLHRSGAGLVQLTAPYTKRAEQVSICGQDVARNTTYSPESSWPPVPEQSVTHTRTHVFIGTSRCMSGFAQQRRKLGTGSTSFLSWVVKMVVVTVRTVCMW